MIDVIITKFFPLYFKMAERFENLDNTLRDWTKDKVQKSPVEALNSTRSRKKKEKAISVLENDREKILKQSQSAVERD